MKTLIKILLGILVLFGNNICLGQIKQQYAYRIKSTKELKEFFRKTPDRIPLLCAHRGGANAGFPENAIETFENTISNMYTFFEIDPRLTKDSIPVLMHDATLNRTTTGKGRLSSYTYEQVKKLYLKDPQGKLTSYRIPTLEETIKWSKGRTILMIDKKDVPIEMLLEIITRLKAESHVILTTSDPKDAQYYHARNKNIMFEAFIKNEKHLRSFEQTGIPWSNMIAYVSQPKSKEFYNKLHEKGMMIMVYTTPVMEKIPDYDERVNAYKKVLSDDVDIFLSDNVFEVSPVMKMFEPKKSKKKKYFKMK